MAGRGRASSVTDEVLRSLAKRMKEERTNKGLSLTKMAELTQYTKSYLSTIENALSRPTPDVVRKYEEVLQMDSNTLLSILGGESARARSSGEALPVIAPSPKESFVLVRDSLPTAVLANMISASEHRIFILENWIGDDLRYLKDAFMDADARGVEIKITLLDENSPFAKQRTDDLRLDSEHQQVDTAELIRANKKLLSEWHVAMQHLEVREHYTLPSIQIIIIDNQAMVGFYFHGLTSRGGPQLAVPLKEGKLHTALGFYLEKEFNYVWWEKAKPVAFE